jgi:hypothetical protein
MACILYFNIDIFNFIKLNSLTHTVIFVQLARWIAIYHVHSSSTRYDDSSYLHVLLMVAFCSLYLDCSCFVEFNRSWLPPSTACRQAAELEYTHQLILLGRLLCLELSDLNVLLVWSRHVSSIAPAAVRSVCSANSSYPSSTSPVGCCSSTHQDDEVTLTTKRV